LFLVQIPLELLILLFRGGQLILNAFNMALQLHQF
jgi:hypothetical protein